jgi:aminoglycoside 3-N-acetyltransferase
MQSIISVAQLSQQLHELGVNAGGVLLVHCAFSQVRPVEQGPIGLIAALQTILGPAGTLVMPSMTSIRDQPFDEQTTSCMEMGVVADTFWRMPSVLRSDSPHAFAALGADASWITALHPVTVPHGLDSPVGRVYELDGQVLLLGVGQENNTTIHLAENLAGVRYRRKKYNMVFINGILTRVEYGEIDHCCQNFALVDDWLDERGMQQRGQVGHARARLIRSRDIVDTVTKQLQANETVFLHPPGIDTQCDEARVSIVLGWDR